MTGFLWACSRCGCVGFHSEACIAADASEKSYERGYQDGLAAARLVPAEDEGRLREAAQALLDEFDGTYDPKDRLIAVTDAIPKLRAAIAATPEPRPGSDWTDPKG